MIKRKYFSVLAITVVLMASTLILLKDRSPFGAGNTSFVPDPGKEITRIEFSGREGKLILSRSDGVWLVNGKYEARKASIMFITRILTEMQIKSTVSPELFEKEISGKGISPVRVRVFEKSRKISSFLVYKTGSNIYGNVMKVKDSSKPFILHMPGTDAPIGSAFTLNELYWQPYSVFRLLPSEIVSVELENHSDTASSFIINREGGLSLSAGGRLLTGWDTARINRYLSYFTLVPFESWALDISSGMQDSIKRRDPLFRIRVYGKNGERQELILWEKQQKSGDTIINDSDRLYGRTGAREDLFIIRYLDIDPLLKKRSYFFPG